MRDVKLNLLDQTVRRLHWREPHTCKTLKLPKPELREMRQIDQRLLPDGPHIDLLLAAVNETIAELMDARASLNNFIINRRSR